MQNALNPQRYNSVKPISELIKGSDSTPINNQVAEIRNTVARLRLELKLSKAFLSSGNIKDGPNTVNEIEGRVSQVRTALTEICRLDIRDPEFEVNFRRVRNGVFGENN